MVSSNNCNERRYVVCACPQKKVQTPVLAYLGPSPVRSCVTRRMAGSLADAKELARRLNLLELLSDANPGVDELSPEDAKTWTTAQIRKYFETKGDERPDDTAKMEDELEPTPLPPSTRADGMYTCQRIGCDAAYDPSDPDLTNPPGCCRHHPGAPLFHEGNKSWTCCGQKSHDFSMFMDIPGCAVGRHTQRRPPKPAIANPVASTATAEPTRVGISKTADAKTASDTQLSHMIESTPASSKENCNRCKSGFFCADHAGSAEAQAAYVAPPSREIGTPSDSKVQAPEIDPDAVQICRNVGCGERFTENTNGDELCKFHPGPPIFHERKKGWACCNETRWDFDDFLKIPTCAVGRHSANPEGSGGFAKTKPK